jgi:hypothetical protein
MYVQGEEVKLRLRGWTLKSTPMVAGWSAAKESSVNRRRMLDLPTPLRMRAHVREN